MVNPYETLYLDLMAVHFNDIYKEYFQSSFFFVRSYVRDQMAAEDIVSESLISLWSHMKKEEVENVKALLVSILKNNSLNYLKHQIVKQNAIDGISSRMARDMEYRITTLQACDPEELFSSEILEIVEKTLAELPEQTRKVFEMSRYEQLPVKEIAARLNMNPKSVEYHITKSLKVLRISLAEYLPAFMLLFHLPD